MKIMEGAFEILEGIWNGTKSAFRAWGESWYFFLVAGLLLTGTLLLLLLFTR